MLTDERETFTVENMTDPLQEYRTEIDGIDKELLRLFCRRMETAEKIAAYKAEKSLPVFDAKREEELLENIKTAAGEEHAQDALQLYGTILSLSKSRQERILSSLGECK